MSTHGTQAVERAMVLLAAVVEAGHPVTFAGLCARSGLPKSTVSRLMLALERGRMVERDESGRFVPGEMLARFAQDTRHGAGDITRTENWPMSIIEETAGPAAAATCGDVRRGTIDLRCEQPQGHADEYEPGSGDETLWHSSVLRRREEVTYPGARVVVDITETATWEPVDHVAEATRHLMAGRRRTS